MVTCKPTITQGSTGMNIGLMHGEEMSSTRSSSVDVVMIWEVPRLSFSSQPSSSYFKTNDFLFKNHFFKVMPEAFGR